MLPLLSPLPASRSYHLAVGFAIVNSGFFVGVQSRRCQSQPCEDYCCQRENNTVQFCCSDCLLSTNKNECTVLSYWAYVGYAIGSLVAICVLVGLGCVLAKLFKTSCCKRRATSVAPPQVRQTRRSGREDSLDIPHSGYPRAPPSPPPPPPPPPEGLADDGWADRLPKKPPEYYDIFAANPPPPYSESAV